jgi:integrase
MPLSDNSCKKAAATDKPRKLADSGGLFLYVTPSGAKLWRLGFDTKTEVTGHGFRATARTLLDERLKFPAHIIEAQLAHAVRDALGRSYNRTQFLDERHEMMAAWADYLDRLKAGAEIVPLRKGAA